MNISELLKELEEEENRSSSKGKVDYKLLFFKYLKKWKWFASGLLIALIAAFLITYFSTPQYEIKATLLLKDKEKGADFNSNAVVNNLTGFSSTTTVENEAEIFKSESLMIKACQELGITNGYFVPNGLFRWKEIYGPEVPVEINIIEKNPFPPKVKDNTVVIKILSEEQFEIQIPNAPKVKADFGESLTNFFGTFTVEKNPEYFPQFLHHENEIKVGFYDPVGVGKDFAENLKVEIVNKLSSVIELVLYNSHPERGKIVLDKLIEIYNQEADNEKNSTALNTLNFIDEQLIDLTAELADIERKAERFKLNNAITDVSAEAQLFLNSTTANRQQISELSVQIGVLESIEQYIMSSGNEFGMVPSTLSIQDPTLADLITNFNSIQREKERMLRTTQPNNPIVTNLNEQLIGLRKNILENIRNIKQGLVISRNSLLETSGEFQTRASRVPTIERELLEISRQQEIKQEHYLLLTRKREEAALTLAATSISNSKVIDPPTPTDYPVKPKKVLIFGIWTILGLIFPYGLIFVKDLLSEKIEFKSDIESITSTKILGEISRNNTNEGTLVIGNGKKSLLAEQFRFIRTNMITELQRKTNQVIMVTSGISGEGKTFFSINLAASLGLIGKKVAVLELDLRRPALLSSLGIQSAIGISEFLENEDHLLEEIIHPLEQMENVSVLGCGAPPNNPAELMISDKLHDMVNDLKKNFDYVIIDTAPVGLVSDAFVLAETADLTIFMVRLNHSTKSQIKTIEDIRSNKKFKKPMIVLNDAVMELTYGYGKKYAGGYYHAK